jgi:hypothetical protein
MGGDGIEPPTSWVKSSAKIRARSCPFGKTGVVRRNPPRVFGGL